MSDANLTPRRSVLYMPAANERALEKAKAIPADALIFDLEDAVAPEAKPEARARAVEAVRAGVKGAVILDGRLPHACLLELFTKGGIGTMIRN